ncbi:ABC-type transport auxiliary lipoprotein family protein [Thalassorhabdomicrobium marinisediminis]|uniref:ABC-type transport auxiliary lipoprotein component domain-containing protein n=1 Tax=Thalassorhabdomicrobium marinisediminis TaxID=2170577 RepID=A0A2T7FWV3_9RHOB|nr:ABC-type transport auxiliary lipoprotein family protein [Thalassorhabdomicrobium marinisediminis]PVA06646.1 hypothetical protein DC363_08940 [Thalassorhabdomicrobium marinisediminis]
MPLPALLRRLGLAATLPLLAGCSALGALNDVSTPLGVYELRAPDTLPTARRTAAHDIIVEVPTTSGVLETDRILIRPDPLQAQYLPNVRWGDEAPLMLQTLLLRSLEGTDGFRYVGRRPLSGRGDYALLTELVDFHAEPSPTGPEATVRLRMTSRLVREADARVVSTRTFTATAPAASTETPALIAAFDQASDAVMVDFSQWVLATVGG